MSDLNHCQQSSGDMQAMLLSHSACYDVTVHGSRASPCQLPLRNAWDDPGAAVKQVKALSPKGKAIALKDDDGDLDILYNSSRSSSIASNRQGSSSITK